MDGSVAISPTWAGTLVYIVPEVWNSYGKPVVTAEAERALRRADIYSFAVMLYECLTGGLPLSFPTVRVDARRPEIHEGIHTATMQAKFLPSRRIPSSAWQVFLGAFAKEPSRRPSSARRFVERVRRAWTEPLVIPVPTSSEDLSRWRWPVQIIHGNDEAPMVLIPEQTFEFGHASEGAADNQPAVSCRIRPFYIDMHLVTNRQYAKFAFKQGFVPEGTWREYYKPGVNDDEPARGLRYKDAEQYCAWAGKSLPLEMEWECAAKAGKNLLYPWGDGYMDGMAHAGLDNTEPIPVGSYASYGYGLFDMAGNVAEFMRGWYGPDFHSRLLANNSLTMDESGSIRLTRGGHFGSPPDHLMTISRGKCDPDLSDCHVGFRTVWYPRL